MQINEQQKENSEPPHLLNDTVSGSKLRPGFAIYGGVGDTVRGQAFDFSEIIPTAVSIVDKMRSSISQPQGTVGLIPVLESVKIVERRKEKGERTTITVDLHEVLTFLLLRWSWKPLVACP